MTASSGERFLGIIPARGGSKGIPGKNLVEVGGKPLIAHTIAAGNVAVEAGELQRVIVSTDDESICNISKSLGADVPFLRPPELSGDQAKSLGYVLHALDFLFSRRGEKYDVVVILQPTSPLRTGQDIIEAIRLFKAHSEDSLISCYYEPSILDTILYHHQGDFAVPITPTHNDGSRRQDTSRVYVRNGAMYICRSSYVRESGRLISKNPLMLEMPKERSINLDTIEDLQKLREILGEQGTL